MLEICSKQEHISMSQLTQAVSNAFKLTNEERRELLPSGRQSIISNRVAWAKTHLAKAGLFNNSMRGVVKLTDEGRRTLNSNQEINLRFLSNYESYREFRAKVNPEKALTSLPQTEASFSANPLDSKTEDEKIYDAIEELNASLSQGLLMKVRAMDWADFENLVVKLLVKMGYGGNLAEAGQATKKSHDDGIDGVIKEDRLGLGKIYIQAKRYKEGLNVQRPEIDGFVGALTRHGVKKGVFITASEFSKGAHVDNLRSDITIILIDGRKLVDYMIELNVGVITYDTVLLKKIDDTYF